MSNFRFDEAAKTIYQFVWHSYCDWYIEFLKPIFASKNKKNELSEARHMVSFIQANILILLHPFIPFFTQKIWLDLNYDSFFKSPLMHKNWSLPDKIPNLYTKSYLKIDWLIELISNIRATKVDLDIPPGTFISISINELSNKKIQIIKDNEELLMRLARITNISKVSKNTEKSSVKIIVGLEYVTLHFDNSIDLTNQKIKMTNTVYDLEKKILNINNKLKNKSFLKNAPKYIVKRDKEALSVYKIELKKLNTIINSIKN